LQRQSGDCRTPNPGNGPAVRSSKSEVRIQNGMTADFDFECRMESRCNLSPDGDTISE